MPPALQTIAGVFSKARLRAAVLLSSWLDAGARLRSLSEEERLLTVYRGQRFMRVS